MKEIAGTARNLMISIDGRGGAVGIVEAILVLSEPVFRVDQGGSLVRMREAETFRFSTTPDGLRALAKDFGEWADEMDAATVALGEKVAKATKTKAKKESTP
jgi:hypothetical protein